MLINAQILSDIIVHMKYSRYDYRKKRRESWEEIVKRNMDMHLKQYPELKGEIREVYKYVFDKKILPSMRSMQFAGKAIERNPCRIYNCAFVPVDHPDSFGEIVFLLLGGTGVGYSVQKHHIEKLPAIRKPNPKRNRRFLIADSIEGWSDAVKILMRAYFYGRSTPVFDYSDIRAQGVPLKTSGGVAPGPEPIKRSLNNIRYLLDRKEEGDSLTPLEVHDIICHLADMVLAGGIRRAALISLFSFTDEEMITCKFGNWYEKNPQRGRSNNSAKVLRHKIKKKDFQKYFERVKESNSGEPGISLSNNMEWGFNPCQEIALRAAQFCNLVEINAATMEDQEDFETRAQYAAFLATLQAGYTDFHYLRNVWKKTTEKEALIGVSLTGVASCDLSKFDLKEGAEVVKAENERVASLIGINKAARTTTIKPAGTSSLVLGCSSGCHAYHAKYYLRTIRVKKNEPIYGYMVNALPEIVEDDIMKPTTDACIRIPLMAPEGSIVRGEETMMDFLERVKLLNEEWVQPGHRSGQDGNNVSATVSVKEDDWDELVEWMWKNKECYNGLSVLPYDGGTYKQAPFETCTKEEYEQRSEALRSIDLTQIKEYEDKTDLQGELACSADGCEIS